MDSCKMKVTKEWYETYKRQGDCLTPDQKMTLFGASIMMGYGLYGYSMKEENGEYICSYSCGTTCD